MIDMVLSAGGVGRNTVFRVLGTPLGGESLPPLGCEGEATVVSPVVAVVAARARGDSSTESAAPVDGSPASRNGWVSGEHTT